VVFLSDTSRERRGFHGIGQSQYVVRRHNVFGFGGHQPGKLEMGHRHSAKILPELEMIAKGKFCQRRAEFFGSRKSE
jgi:hypothetical protein